MEQTAQNRRKIVRNRVLKGGYITFKGHSSTINCTIRNLSDHGACLKVESPIGIPDQFDLVLGNTSIYHCCVTWRKATRIGVNFIWRRFLALLPMGCV